MFGRITGKSFTDEKKKNRAASATIRDLISGDVVEICDPESYELETILVDSAFYKFRGKEFRFLLCQARESGLKIA